MYGKCVSTNPWRRSAIKHEPSVVTFTSDEVAEFAGGVFALLMREGFTVSLF